MSKWLTRVAMLVSAVVCLSHSAIAQQVSIGPFPSGTAPLSVYPPLYVGALGSDGLIHPIATDSSGHLIITGTVTGGGGTQYTAGVTQATPIGTVGFGIDPSNVLNPLHLDASELLKIGIYTPIPAGSNVIGGVTQSGTWNVLPQPTTIAATVSDGAFTLTLASTDYTLVGVNATRKRIRIQNPSTAATSVFIMEGGAASTTPGASDELSPGQTWADGDEMHVWTGAIHVIATDAGHVIHLVEE